MTTEVPTDLDLTGVTTPTASTPRPVSARAAATRVRHDVETPDLVGTDLMLAYQLVRGEGLRLSVSVRESKIGPWGQILSQSPPAGTRTHSGSRVHIIVSGRPHVVVPDVRGLAAPLAADELARLGLQPATIEQRRSRSVPAGQVINTKPGPGSLVPHGSLVTIVMAVPSPSAGHDRIGRPGRRAGSPVRP